jgi:uncharacterized protein (TIGR03435 family)
MPTSTEVNRRAFRRIAPVLAIVCFMISPPHGRAQSASSAPAFDVISVKQNKSDSGGMSINGSTENFKGTNLTISNLIMNSYNLTSEDLIFGLPGWACSAHFDVDAKVDNPDKQVLEKLTNDQRKAMRLDILRERFHFQAHFETKTLPVYNLVLAKSGPKFTGGKRDAETAAAMAKRGITASNGTMIVYDGEITGGGIPVSSLVFSLTGAVGRTVIDKTGLTGNYDVELKWTPENGDQSSTDNGQTDAQSGPSIFTALEEQLGLKLQPAKGPVQTLVVDRVEMPTEN